MSLSSHLDDKGSPVREFIRTAFGDVVSNLARDARQQLKTATTVRPETSAGYAYSTIGTAVDYRLRYYFAVTPHEEFVAYKGAAYLAHFIPNYIDLAQEFFGRLTGVIASISPVGKRLAELEEHTINRYCYVLALLEQLTRSLRTWDSSALFKHGTLNEWLSIPNSQEITDLSELSWLFYGKHHRLLSFPHVLNPTFEGSNDVDGADADIIVNKLLVELKTTTRPTEKTAEALYQLLGYALLDYADEYQINAVGLYMVRQGLLLQWNLESILENISLNFAELRSQFQEVAANSPRESTLI